MTLSTVADVTEICSVVVFPVGALLVWHARRWIREEIVSKLSNDDTPVAKYAHDARDFASDAKDYARQAFETSQKTNEMLVEHVTDSDLHFR